MNQYIKNIIKKFFSFFGFEIHRKRTKDNLVSLIINRRTMLSEILDHLLKLDFRPQTILDVGAAYGTFDLYDKFPEAKHILIEPLKEFEEALKKIAQKYNAEYILAAVGQKPGKIQFNVHSDLTGSSIYKEAEGSHVDGIPREVDVKTIDYICSERNLRSPYLIKIDTQGAEIDVLNGAKEVLEDTEVIILEASLFQFFINGPQFYDVVSYMKKLGFVVYDLFGGHNRPFDGALAQVDMVFVKEYGRFKKYNIYATREQRKKLTQGMQISIANKVKKILNK